MHKFVYIYRQIVGLDLPVIRVNRVLFCLFLLGVIKLGIMETKQIATPSDPNYFDINFRYQDEIFKPISTFENYLISNYGRVKSVSIQWVAGKGAIRKNKSIIRRPYKWGGEYWGIVLYNRGNHLHRLIHQFVAYEFVEENRIENPSFDYTVNHKDGNKSNNHFSNLEWMTRGENTSHAHRTGLMDMIYGENHSQAKLTDDKVRHIRRMRKHGTSYNKIARFFGVSKKTIININHNRIWKHVK